MRFPLIEDHQGVWPVRVMCDALSVSPSGYYAWRSRPDSPRKIANRDLLANIRRVHAQHEERYGAPRVHAELRAEGQTVSCKRVERVMRQHGLRARAPRRYRVCTTDSKHSLPVAANLLDQNFVADQPNQVWLADITYIPTSEGWLYLAVALERLAEGGSGVDPLGLRVDVGEADFDVLDEHEEVDMPRRATSVAVIVVVACFIVLA
jgi:putative transposase